MKALPLTDLVKKCGWAAFLFFLIKGLLWLIIPAILYLWGSGTPA